MRERRESERADERSGERPGLPNIPSPRAGRTDADGRAGGRDERGGSAFLPPPVAGGHAIRVESVSDCHDGRSVGQWAEEVWAFNARVGTRNKEGRKDRNKGREGGGRKDFL